MEKALNLVFKGVKFYAWNYFKVMSMLLLLAAAFKIVDLIGKGFGSLELFVSSFR